MTRVFVPYTCPRCGYTTEIKSNMKKHLYKSQKTCATKISPIELTENIKKHVIEYRVYHTTQPVTNNVTVNYNTMNTFVSNMDFSSKLGSYLDYTNKTLPNFDDSVESSFNNDSLRLESLSKLDSNMMLDREDLFQIVNKISKSKESGEFNVFYDPEMNRINIFEDGNWEEMLVITGIKRIINIIRDHYLNAYECYLVRCIFDCRTSALSKSKSREHLSEYYDFIGSFNIEPYVKNKENSEIIGNVNSGNQYEIEENIMPLYKLTKDKLTQSSIERKKRDFLDILKRNSKRNIYELNKNIMDLIRVDEEFKKTIGFV